MKRHYLLILLISLLGASLAGCNTTSGLGEDIENAGDEIEETADEVEDELD